MAKEVDAWFADQFPAREGFVGARALVGILSGQKQSNGILLGEGGQLARWSFDGSETDRIDETRLCAACAGINRVAANAGVPTVFLLPSRNLDIVASAFDYPNVTSEKIRTVLREELSDKVALADTEPILREKYEQGENVIFRTDHHWTALGAYYAYCEVMERFGREADILPRQFFREEVVTGGFSGTYRARGGMPWVQKEPITVWYGDDDADYTVIADGKPLDGFYTIPEEGEIGYELFLDGTHDVVTIEKAGETRPKLLVLKDSFANALAPFLARHFDLILVNLSSPKQDYTNVSELSKAYDADAVLVVYSIYNLLTTDTAARFQ